MDIPLRFGAELRRLRESAGMTLQQLADLMNYSRGHLSKIERGTNLPTMNLVQRCDAHFNAGGRLRRLFLAEMESAGRKSKPGRRQVIAKGVGSALAAGLAEGGLFDDVSDSELPLNALFRDQLHQMRQLGQRLAPAAALPVLRSQASTVIALASRASGSSRAELLTTASRFAEYIGWMAQENGDEAAALKATTEAVGLAHAGGDEHLASYALVRRALITYYNGDASRTIALARQAQHGAAPPRIRGLAAQREAQGHALAGDERACGRALDRARDLLAVQEAPDEPVLGTTQLADPVSMVTGWCLYDLGRPRQAAVVLESECRRIAPHALNTRTRYGLRRALALAAAGEVESSCEVAGEFLASLSFIPSATVRTDVCRLDREWSRFRGDPAVRRLRPTLAHVLNSGN